MSCGLGVFVLASSLLEALERDLICCEGHSGTQQQTCESERTHNEEIPVESNQNFGFCLNDVLPLDVHFLLLSLYVSDKDEPVVNFIELRGDQKQ